MGLGLGVVVHPNEEIVRAAYDAFVRGNIDAVAGFLDPDVIWHAAGSGPFAGLYKGHGELIGLFARISEATEGSISLSARDILANDDHVIVLTKMEGRRGDRVLDDNGVAIFKIVGGKATEVWTFPEDEAALEAFFS